MREPNARTNQKSRKEVPGAKPSSLNSTNIPIESRNSSGPISLSWKKKMPSSRPSVKKSTNSKTKLSPSSNKTHNYSPKTNDSPKSSIRKNLTTKFSKTSTTLKIPKSLHIWMSSNTKRKNSSKKSIILKVNSTKSKESRTLKSKNWNHNSNLKSKASRGNHSPLRKFMNKSWESSETPLKRKNTKSTRSQTDWKEFLHKVNMKFWDSKRKRKSSERSWCTFSKIAKNKSTSWETNLSQITLMKSKQLRRATWWLWKISRPKILSLRNSSTKEIKKTNNLLQKYSNKRPIMKTQFRSSEKKMTPSEENLLSMNVFSKLKRKPSNISWAKCMNQSSQYLN